MRPKFDRRGRARAPAERVVRVIDGRLLKFKLESGRTGDSDYHLVITDETLQFSPGGSNTQPVEHSFVAEIVDPDCVGGRHGNVPTPSQLQNQIVDVHTRFLQQFQDISGGWNDAGGIPVRLTGMTFFDRPHGQTGRAPNVVELHPLLAIEFNPGGGSVLPVAAGLLQNRGFEDGAQGWTATADVISDDTNEPAHNGNFKAWFGGFGTPHTDRLSQQAALPANAAAISLTFFLHVSTEEQTTTEAFDKLRVQVRRANGQVATLGTFSNLQAAPGFTLRAFPLNQFRGQTIRIQLIGTEDNGSMTSFVADDFAIVVE